MAKMTEYYREMLEVGGEFQDFVIDLLLRELGLAISMYSSRRYQATRGESAQGVEIKFDRKLHETGNLYIEVAEKTRPENPDWVPSGIYRNDNSWLYAIGDYTILYLFSKKWLQRLHASGKYDVITIDRGTSRGFLLRDAEKKLAMKEILTGLTDPLSLKEEKKVV